MNPSRVRRKKLMKSRARNRYSLEERHRLGISATARAKARAAEKAAAKAAGKSAPKKTA